MTVRRDRKRVTRRKQRRRLGVRKGLIKSGKCSTCSHAGEQQEGLIRIVKPYRCQRECMRHQEEPRSAR